MEYQPDVEGIIENEKRQKAIMQERISKIIKEIKNNDASNIGELFSYSDDSEFAVLRKIARLTSVQSDVQKAFAYFWVTSGDTVRDGLVNDLLLLDAMRSLLPPYPGPALVAYRGESFYNRRRRTYGMSWSKNQEVANNFAKVHGKNTHEGSVLLRAEVPSDAVILVVSDFRTDDYGEQEVIVDRRRLKAVSILKRYSHIEFKSSGCDDD